MELFELGAFVFLRMEKSIRGVLLEQKVVYNGEGFSYLFLPMTRGLEERVSGPGLRNLECLGSLNLMPLRWF